MNHGTGMLNAFYLNRNTRYQKNKNYFKEFTISYVKRNIPFLQKSCKLSSLCGNCHSRTFFVKIFSFTTNIKSISKGMRYQTECVEKFSGMSITTIKTA